MVSTIVICSTIAFCTLCSMFCNVKKISSELYKQIAINDSLPKSPYSLIRTKNYKGELGYTITKDGEIIYLPKTNNTEYEVYSTISGAIYEINVLEKIEGYRLTKL